MNFNFIFYIAFLIVTLVKINGMTLDPGPFSCDYKKKDLKENYDINSSVIVNCNDGFCTINGEGAIASAGLVNITAAGTYVLQGTLEGKVVIATTIDEHVQLVLDDASIFSNNGPAIYGVSADKITLTVIGNSTLTDSTEYNLVNGEPNACLFVDTDLSINGSGTLTVMGRFNDAIRSKKDLKIINTKINIPHAIGKGIKAKNSVCMKDVTLNINSVGTGIKVTRDDHPDKGFIVIDGGSYTIATGKDGIHAQTHLTINDGYIDIKESTEGFEAQMIDILGGQIYIVSTNDGINASKTKASTSVASAEKYQDVYINIVGGKTYVSVQGDDCDGIDSNGILYIGGEAEVYASIHGGNIYGEKAALEADDINAIVQGATVIATANQSDTKIENGNGSSSGRGGGSIFQPYLYTSVATQTAGTEIVIKDSDNNVIASYKPQVNYHKVFVTSPKLIFGKTYSLFVGDQVLQVVFASDGHSGSVDSPSVASPAFKKPSTFEEVTVLDKEIDVDDQVGVNILDDDEQIVKDYIDNTKIDDETIEGIEEEIDDTIDESTNNNNKESEKVEEENQTNNNNSTNNEENDDTSPPKYFHYNPTKVYNTYNENKSQEINDDNDKATTSSSSIDNSNEQPIDLEDIQVDEKNEVSEKVVEGQDKTDNSSNKEENDDESTPPKYFHYDPTKVYNTYNEGKTKEINDDNSNSSTATSNNADVKTSTTQDQSKENVNENKNIDDNNIEQAIDLEDLEAIIEAYEKVVKNQNKSDNSNNNDNEKNEEDNITLPKYFHYDIIREGENTGNTNNKWRKEE